MMVSYVSAKLGGVTAKLGGVPGGLCLLCFTAMPVAGQQAYTVTDLGTLGGLTSDAKGINDRSQVVGWAENLVRDARAYRRAEGDRKEDLGTLPGGYRSLGWGINELGYVVGGADTPESYNHAFLWIDGVMKDLGTLGGSQSVAVSVNNSAWVVGRSYNADEKSRVFLWRDGAMEDLGTLGGCCSHPGSINEAGQVVGYSAFNERRDWHAFLWQDGQMSDLGTLGGVESGAYDINNREQIVGWSEVEGGETHAFVWENGQMRDLGAIDGYSSARAINESGVIVGSAKVSGDEYHAARWDGEDITDLNDFLHPCTPLDVLLFANDVNEAGQIVGLAGMRRYGVEFDRGFLLTPLSCDDVDRLKVRCNPKKRQIIAVLKGQLPPGTLINLTNDGFDCRSLVIGPGGKGKVRWKEQSESARICVAECPDRCRTVECD